jgi:hypothetical protein
VSVEAVYAVLPFVVALALGFAFWATYRQRWFVRQRPRAGAGGGGTARPADPASDRPWWGNPLLWVAVSAASLALGLFVSPKLFGGVIIFLPFLWVGGWPRRERRPPDPSQNGHGDRNGTARP